MHTFEKNMKLVIAELCEYYGTTEAEILSKTRKRTVTDARFILALWVKKNTTLSLTEIGKIIRYIPYDHTSVIHAVREAENILNQDSNALEMYKRLPKLRNCNMVADIEDKQDTRITVLLNDLRFEIKALKASVKSIPDLFKAVDDLIWSRTI